MGWWGVGCGVLAVCRPAVGLTSVKSCTSPSTVATAGSSLANCIENWTCLFNCLYGRVICLVYWGHLVAHRIHSLCVDIANSRDGPCCLTARRTGQSVQGSLSGLYVVCSVCPRPRPACRGDDQEEPTADHQDLSLGESCSEVVQLSFQTVLCQMEEQNERDDEIREATERLSNRELAEYKEIFRFFDKGNKRRWADSFGFLKNRWVETGS